MIANTQSIARSFFSWPKFTSRSFDKMWPEFRSYTQYFWQKILGYSQMKAQTTLIQKILHLFLRKLPKKYCKCQKRNRKLRSVHVHLVRNELSSAHIHFSLLKSDQHSVHERELNVNWTEKVQFLQCSGWAYTHS